MEITIDILKYLLPPAYLAVAVAYGRWFWTEDEGRARAFAHAGLALALAMHTSLLLLIAARYHRCPLGTLGEGWLFWAWIMGWIHLLSEWWAGKGRLGIFTVLPTTIGVWAGSAFLRTGLDLPPQYRNSYFVFHIVASLASYACLSMAATLAVMYLLLYRRLKAKRFDIAFRKLPPLDELDRLSAAWSTSGALTMLLSSWIGWTWVRHSALPGMHPRELAIFLVLAVFLGLGLGRRIFAFRGRRHAYAVLTGFCLLLLANLLRAHGFDA